MKLTTLVQTFLLFTLFFVGYGLFAQALPSTIPTNGRQLFFFMCLIIATALGRKIDKIIEKLISLIPSRKDETLTTNASRKSKE